MIWINPLSTETWEHRGKIEKVNGLQRPPYTGSSSIHRAPSGFGDDAIGVFERDHAAYLKLCDSLESVADSLPNQVSAATCHKAMLGLESRVALHHVLEDRALFPMLRMRAPTGLRLYVSLDRLGDEHANDEGYAAEVMDLLETLASDSFSGDCDAAGYLLRGFFESVRRHIAFENDFILPLARRFLTEEDQRRLTDLITNNPERLGRQEV